MKYIFLAVLSFSIIASASNSYAQVEKPTIKSAAFDSNGKLIVKADHAGFKDCYFTINGGLSRSKVDTGITSKQLSAHDEETGKVKIKTVKKYYCKKRTLYVNAELTCYGDVVGQATSEAVAVSVPQGNIRR